MKPPHRPPMTRACSAGTLLRELLARWGMEGKLREYQAFLVWDEVVGPQIAVRAQPAKIRSGVLEVRVDQPVWMQQLQLMKPKILARLNERLGDRVINDIFWRRGRIDRASSAPGIEQSAPNHRAHAPLSPEDRAAIEAALAPVADPALRQGIRSLLTRQLQAARKPKQDGHAPSPSP
jgi:hypothetical protein